MNTITKPKILINPPPMDFKCEKCGRPFNELPIFQGVNIDSIDDMFKKDHIIDANRNIRLVKTFRGHQSISASWECWDCICTPDLSDFIVDCFGDDDPYSEEKKTFLRRTKERFRYWKIQFVLTRKCKNAINKGKKQFEWENLLMPVAYWERALQLVKLKN